jgi:hypothetical protein
MSQIHRDGKIVDYPGVGGREVGTELEFCKMKEFWRWMVVTTAQGCDFNDTQFHNLKW